MSEEELLLGHVLFAPVGLNKDSGPRLLLGRISPWTGLGPRQPIILGRSPQFQLIHMLMWWCIIIFHMHIMISQNEKDESKLLNLSVAWICREEHWNPLYAGKNFGWNFLIIEFSFCLIIFAFWYILVCNVPIDYYWSFMWIKFYKLKKNIYIYIYILYFINVFYDSIHIIL